MTIQGKKAGTALIIAGVLCWFGAIIVFTRYWGSGPLGFLLHQLCGALIFLIIAAFIPETENRRFTSRQSVLSGMALLIALGLMRISRINGIESVSDSIWMDLLLLAGPFVLAFAAYKIALLAYRGIEKSG